MTEWSQELIDYRLQRSRAALADARALAQAGSWNTCVSRLYCACFYWMVIGHNRANPT